MGAICNLRSERPDEERASSYSVGEFVTLDDGRRVLLHCERGWTESWWSSSRSRSDEVDAMRGYPKTEDLIRTVLNVVLPDDDECTDAHPWEWLADLARARGLGVSVEDLQRLPYEVVFTRRLRRWLAQVGAE